MLDGAPLGSLNNMSKTRQKVLGRLSNLNSRNERSLLLSCSRVEVESGMRTSAGDQCHVVYVDLSDRLQILAIARDRSRPRHWIDRVHARRSPRCLAVGVQLHQPLQGSGQGYQGAGRQVLPHCKMN